MGFIGWEDCADGGEWMRRTNGRWGEGSETRKHFGALLYTELLYKRGRAMRKLLHQDLMRGHKAQRAAIILFTGLLLVLLAAFFHGVVLLRP